MSRTIKIDTHVHAWNPEKVDYPWLKGNTGILNKTWSLDTLEPELESNGITYGVMVQAANNLDDTHSMLEECRQRAWLKGVVGWLPLTEPGRSEEESAKLLLNPYFKGIRHLIHDEADPYWLVQNTVIHSFGLLERKKIPFDVVANRPEHLECVLKLSEKYPEMKWCIDHLANPPAARKERWGLWGDRMKALADNPNVFIKLSGLGMTTANKETWTGDEIQPYVEFSLERFGTKRAMMGGDWPVVELCGGYTKSWQTNEKLLRNVLSDPELDAVFATNAVGFYSLSV